MRKIVGFKIRFKSGDVERRAKKALGNLEQAGLDAATLEKLIEDAAKAVAPAVLFATFPETDADRSKFSPLPGLAYTLILASIGESLWPLKASQRAPEAFWPVVEQAALEECVRFASGLVAEEAAKESCDLSPLSPLRERELLEAAWHKLDGAKIGIKLSETGLWPAATSAACLSWLSRSKARGKTR